MRVNFVVREDGPESLVCEAELVFDDEYVTGPAVPGGVPVVGLNPFHGLKLVGFSLWRGVEGEIYVTVPSRPFGVSTERRYFDYVRDVEPGSGRVKALKEWILDAYLKSRSESQVRT